MSYYGLKAWTTYLFGETKAMDITYKALFCVFVVVGSAISAQSVFDFGDAMIFAMCFPTCSAQLMAKEVKEDLGDYMSSEEWRNQEVPDSIRDRPVPRQRHAPPPRMWGWACLFLGALFAFLPLATA